MSEITQLLCLTFSRIKSIYVINELIGEQWTFLAYTSHVLIDAGLVLASRDQGIRCKSAAALGLAPRFAKNHTEVRGLLGYPPVLAVAVELERPKHSLKNISDVSIRMKPQPIFVSGDA